MRINRCTGIFFLLFIFSISTTAYADSQKWPLMHPDNITLNKWVQGYEQAPKAAVKRDVKAALPIRINLLPHLSYRPSEHQQGECGNCWLWAGTGALSIALDVQESIKDRLSVQFANSCNTSVDPCEGGWFEEFTRFYNKEKIAVPWSNNNAGWQGYYGGTGPGCSEIDKSNPYRISTIRDLAVETHGIGQAAAISNIKNILNQKKAIGFSFFMTSQAAVESFYSFWENGSGGLILDVDQLSRGVLSQNGGGHMVLCVGYDASAADPEDHYWIMLNSWGIANKRPTGLFYVKMNIDYDSIFTQDGMEYKSYHFQALDVFFEKSGLIEGRILDSATHTPVVGVKVEGVSNSYSQSDVSDHSGSYALAVNHDEYNLTVSRYGYITKKLTNIVVDSGSQATQDIFLEKSSIISVSGKITDSQTGWPLYSKIEITPEGYDETITVYSNPFTGEYAVDLLPGLKHSVVVSSIIYGYESEEFSLMTPLMGNVNRDLQLTAGENAPGYISGTPPEAGAFVVGFIRDAAGDGINLARVDVGDDGYVVSRVFPDRMGEESGFYYLFISSTNTLSVRKSGFSNQSRLINPGNGLNFIIENFSLSSTTLSLNQTDFAIELYPDQQQSIEVALKNDGDYSAEIELVEIDDTGSEERESRSGRIINYHNIDNLNNNSDLNEEMMMFSGVYQNLEMNFFENDIFQKHYSKGISDTYNGWYIGLLSNYGVGINRLTGDILISHFSGEEVANANYIFTQNGFFTEKSVDLSVANGIFQGDMAYNTNTGTLWQVNVGGDNCIFEIDPVSYELTGNRICPDVKAPQWALAYDPVSRCYYSGSFYREGQSENSVVSVFDNQGNIQNEYRMPYRISGLAYNPLTEHLFVLNYHQKDLPENDVYVYNKSMSLVDQFDVSIYNSGDYLQLGLAIDCDGHLWMTGTGMPVVFEIDSGESGVCDIPWLSADDAIVGNVMPKEEKLLTFFVDTTDLEPGNYEAQIRVDNSTPYTLSNVSVHLKVLEPYKVIFSASGLASGYFNGNAEQNIIPGGNSTSVSAVPAAGYVFLGWSGDYSGSENPLVIENVASDMNIVAKFVSRNSLPDSDGNVRGCFINSLDRSLQNATLSNFCVKKIFDPRNTTGMTAAKSIFCLELE